MHGNAEFDGELNIDGELKTPGEIYIESAKLNTIDLNEINIARFKLIQEGEVIVMRDTQASTDKRYAMYPRKHVDFYK